MAATIISLAALNGADGFRLDGIDAGDGAGGAIDGIGDFNGDGFNDLAVGAEAANGGAGETYIVFGQNGGFGASIGLAALDGSDGLRVDGVNAGDLAGGAVAGGDFNGDGVSDLLIGASGADFGAGGAGAAYVLLGAGAAFGASVALSGLTGADGYRLDGVDAADAAGSSVAAIGDFNGDGIGDFVVGAPGADSAGTNGEGETYVVFGDNNAMPATASLGALDGANGVRLDGQGPGDGSGLQVSDAGDINGDGFTDLAVYADSAAGPVVYVVFGSEDAFATSIALGGLNGADGFRFEGPAIGAYAGLSVGAAGDLNGDGFDDLAIGAHGAASGAGEAYVILGKASGFAATLDVASFDGTNGFTVNGAAAGDRLGAGVDGAGDVNGDGLDDLLLLAPGADIGAGADQGEAIVLFGDADGFAATNSIASLDSTEGVRIQGIAAGDFDLAIDSASGAGDLDGDGFDDIAIGAMSADPAGAAGAGQAFVVLGGDFTGVVTHMGTNGDDNLNGDNNDNILVLGAGDDLFKGHDGADVMRGGEGRDRGSMGDGDDRAFGGAGDDILNGGRGDDMLFGGDGTDRLALGRGNDYADGGAGTDIIYERADNLGAGDRIYGGEGLLDTLYVQSRGTLDLTSLDAFEGIERVRVAADQVIASTDDDLFFIGRSGNEIYGLGDGKDLVKAGGGDDEMYGGGGNDVLIGQGGDDRLEGGLGVDRLVGGPGADIFVFEQGGSIDIVYDFENGVDMIDLSIFGFTDFTTEVQPLISLVGTKTVLDFGLGDRSVLNGIAPADLDASDFILEVILV